MTPYTLQFRRQDARIPFDSVTQLLCPVFPTRQGTVTISRRYVPQIITPNAAAYFPIHNKKYLHCNSKKWMCESCRMFGNYSHHVDGHAVQQEKKQYLTLMTLYCAANQWAQLFLVVKFLLFTINSYMFRFLYQILR
jgi:hypothetical protein